MSLTVGSLFSGVGGIELGLERAGFITKWQVECDPYARRVLEKHWPDVTRYDDVRTAHCGHDRRSLYPSYCTECLEHVDLICGGFPCQDISNAGKRKGIEGERSGLWKEFARIVEEVRPRFVLVENVSALRSRGLAVVLSDLAALGYDAEWDCVPASAVGALHQRDRLFVVAYSVGQSLRDESGRSGGSSGPGEDEPGLDGGESRVARHGERGHQYSLACGHCEPWQNVANSNRQPRDQGRPRDPAERAGGRDSDRGGQPRPLADARGSGLEERIFQPPRPELATFERGGLPGHSWSSEPDVGRVAHGIPARVDRLRCLGNAVVPQVAEHVGRCIASYIGSGNKA